MTARADAKRPERRVWPGYFCCRLNTLTGNTKDTYRVLWEASKPGTWAFCCSASPCAWLVARWPRWSRALGVAFRHSCGVEQRPHPPASFLSLSYNAELRSLCASLALLVLAGVGLSPEACPASGQWKYSVSYTCNFLAAILNEKVKWFKWFLFNSTYPKYNPFSL